MKRISLVLALFLTAGVARAQWIPVSGSIVTTTEAIASDGTVNTKWTTTSQYARSSSGSVLVQRIGRSGKPAAATLIDYGNSKKSYELSYHEGKVNGLHQALDRDYGAHPPTGMSAAQQKISLGNDKVDGVECFMVPVYEVGVNRSRVLIGKAWMAPSMNNLIMKEDVVRSHPDGSRRHIVRKFTVTSRNEPDHALFATDKATVSGLWKAPAATPAQ
jgi:hypothetical protein